MLRKVSYALGMLTVAEAVKLKQCCGMQMGCYQNHCCEEEQTHEPTFAEDVLTIDPPVEPEPEPVVEPEPVTPEQEIIEQIIEEVVPEV